MASWRSSKSIVCQAEAADTAFKPDASLGCAPACPGAGVLCALESLTALDSTEAAESSAPLSALSALSGISGSTPLAWPSSMRWRGEGGSGLE
jgi:hypothetical protein